MDRFTKLAITVWAGAAIALQVWLLHYSWRQLPTLTLLVVVGMAMLAIERVRAITVARAVSGAVRGGSHIVRTDFLHGTGAQEIVLSADHPFALQVDGEALGHHQRAVLSTGPRLLVLTP